MPPLGPGNPELLTGCPILSGVGTFTAPAQRWDVLKLLRLALYRRLNDAGYNTAKSDGDLPGVYGTVGTRLSWIAEEIGLLDPNVATYSYARATINNGWFGDPNNWWVGGIQGTGTAFEEEALRGFEEVFASSIGLAKSGKFDLSHWDWPPLEVAAGAPFADRLESPAAFGVAGSPVECLWAQLNDQRWDIFIDGPGIFFLTPKVGPLPGGPPPPPITSAKYAILPGRVVAVRS